jgi:hypothetical protein
VKRLALVIFLVLSVSCGRAVSGVSPVSSPETFAEPSPVVTAYPSPSPTQATKPKPVAVATPRSTPKAKPVVQTVCSRVVFHSFTAFPGSGLNDIQLAWRVSGGCAPLRGYVAGSYFYVGTEISWTIHFTGGSGTHLDVVKRRTSTGPCTVTIAYMLVIQDGQWQVTFPNAYICPT